MFKTITRFLELTAASMLLALMLCCTGAALEAEASEAAVSDAYAALTEVMEANGLYFSELTGEPISTTIQDQRPIAVMIDNDQRALPHYSLSEADVVYELVNSLVNNRITRLMAVYKDWGNLEMVGNIRSVRPTNILLAQEWEAVICHDGGPYYINDYLSRYNYSFSGTFSRVNNGKATEFTEYILSGDLLSNFASKGYSTTYSTDLSEQEAHFNFAAYGEEVNLAGEYGAVTAADVDLPFYNTQSELKYNAETQTYDYYEFGELAVDGQTGEVITFKNVLILNCSYSVYDSNGYFIYNCITGLDVGWYCTNGVAIPILWNKLSESGNTNYYDSIGVPLTVNTGKTYIALVPNDTWDEVTLK